MAHVPAEDVKTEELSDDASISDVESIGLDLASTEDGLNVSVLWSLSGNVLAIVHLSARSFVWDFKRVMEKRFMPLRIAATRITLMLGLQVLADADTLEDAGIVEGSILSINTGPPYNILVCRGTIAEMWDDGGRFERSFLGHSSEIQTMEFSPDNTFVVTSSWDWTAKLWQTDSAECILTFRGHKAPVTSAVFSISATVVLTASMDGTAKLWSTSSGRCVHTLHHGRGPMHVSTAVSPGGVLVLTMSGYSITVWNLLTGIRMWEVPGSPDFCGRHANFSPKGDWLYICAHPRNVIQLWTAIPTGPQYHCLAEHTGEVRHVAFSADGFYMVTASTDKTAQVWSMETVSRVYTFQHEAMVDSAAISPDVEQVVTVSQKTAWLWNMNAQTLTHSFQHACLAIFTPDGKALVTSGSRGVAIWSAGCGRFCWGVRAKPAGAVAFSHHIQQFNPITDTSHWHSVRHCLQ